MIFGNPHYFFLFLLLPIFILFLIWAYQKKQKLILQFVAEELRDKLLKNISRSRQKIKIVLSVFVVLFLIIALVRPKWGFQWEEVKRRGVDIIIALDVSQSMMAEDVSPNRLERAKREIMDLLKLIEGDRIGLVAFAGTSFLQTPLTLDYGAVQIFLDDLAPDLIPIPGTAIAEAIETSTKSFDQTDKKSRVLILITDGEDHQGDPEASAKKAAAEQVKIYTIGIGKDGGAPIPDQEGGGFKRDSRGEMILTKIDETMLQKIALATGGSYVRATTGDMHLETIYNDIRGNVEDKEVKSGRRKRFEERYQWPLALAIIFLLWEYFLSERIPRRKIANLFQRKSLLVVSLLLAGHQPFAQAFLFSGAGKNAETQYEKGNYADALKEFIDAQISAPNDQKLKYNVGNTYYQLKQYDEAEKSFLNTATLGDKKLSEHSFYNLGNNSYRKGKLDEAVEYYKKALEIDPNDEDAKYNLEFVREEIKRRIEQNKDSLKQQEQQQQQAPNKNEQKDSDGSEQKDQKQNSLDNQNQERKKEEAQMSQAKEDKAREEKDGKEQDGAAAQSAAKMDKEEAERLLNGLDEKRKENLKRQMQEGNNNRYRVEKDWEIT